MNEQQKEQAMELLRLSVLTPATFCPEEKFLNEDSYGVFLGDTPIVFTGVVGDEESHAAACALCEDRFFYDLACKYCNVSTDFLSVREVKTADYFKADEEYICLVPSERGKVETGEDNKPIGFVYGVFPMPRMDVAFGMCISNSVMLTLEPRATPLPFQVRFKG